MILKTTPIISLIVAMTPQRVIGLNNQMPWHLPADLAYFRQQTLGKPIIMGHNTYRSIGKALPGRRNIVLSSQQQLLLPDAEIAHTLEQALALVHDAEEVMIIGGSQVYQQSIHLANKLYITQIDTKKMGDCYFPQWPTQDFVITSTSQRYYDEQQQFHFQFLIYTRQ